MFIIKLCVYVYVLKIVGKMIQQRTSKKNHYSSLWKNKMFTSFLPSPTQLSQDQLEAEEKGRPQRSRRTSLVSQRPYGVPEKLDTVIIRGFWRWRYFSRDLYCPVSTRYVMKEKKVSNAHAIQVDPEGNLNIMQLLSQDSQTTRSFMASTLTWFPRKP